MKKGIQTQIGTYSSHIQPVYNSSDKCPNSLKVYNHALALPLFYSLTEDMIDYATKILKQTIGDFK
jgi:dTDP-4-amino-4,6-dideoxygalactose transaminase